MNDAFEGLSCEINDRVLELLDDMRDMAYLKSFSEEKDNLLMWAHYADNYSGMCVEYDLNTLNTAAKYHLYEEKIKFLADQMIEIDLDDGVKVNHAKFGDVLAKIK